MTKRSLMPVHRQYSGLFRCRRSPLQLVEECLQELEETTGKKSVLRHENHHRFQEMLLCFKKKIPEQKELIALMFDTNFLYLFIVNIALLTHQEKVAFCQLFCYMIRNNIGNVVNVYLRQDVGHRLLDCLIASHMNMSSVYVCSPMLCECFHYLPLLTYYLNHTECFSPLFSNCVHSANWTNRRIVFCTLRELLLGHAECGRPHYASYFFNVFKSLIGTSLLDVQSEGLALLYDYLVLPTTPIYLFLNNVSNLIAILPYILSSCSTVVEKCYSVLKLFICSPKKDKAVRQYLFLNRQKLIVILSVMTPPNSKKWIESPSR